MNFSNLGSASARRLLQSTWSGVAGRPSPTWRTFLRNHVDAIAAVDMFIVVSATFRLLYVLIVLRHDRRKIVHLTSLRIPRSIGWPARSPKRSLGTVLRAICCGIVTPPMVRAFASEFEPWEFREIVTAPRSPWQNAYVERVIGSIRRECLDHIIVFNARHLRSILSSYITYYRQSRTHLSLDKDCPDTRPIQPVTAGKIIAFPEVGGLHHRYERLAA